MKTRRNRTNNGYISHWFTACEMGVLTPQILYQLDLEDDQYGSTPLPDRYKRPSDWLAMPDMTGTDQRVAMLFHIAKGASGDNGATADSNFIAFSLSGAYIVDWGDGTTQAFAAGTTAQYAYNFSSISGGTATETSLQHRQLIVQAYPQAGSDFSRLDLNRVYFGNGVTGLSAGGHHVPLVHLKMCGATFSSIDLGQGTGNVHGIERPQIWLNNMSLFEFVGPSSLTATQGFFLRATNLNDVYGSEWTSNVTNFNSMFSGQTRLVHAPMLNTSSAIFCSSMFLLARALKFVPEYDMRNVISPGNMFSNCVSLDGEGIPTFDVPKASTASFMFIGCTNLTRFVRPIFKNFGKGTTSTSSCLNMFNGCVSLKSARRAFIGVDTSKITDIIQAFTGCNTMSHAPNIYLGSITGAGGNPFAGAVSAFGNCTSLKWVPPYDLSSCGQLANMFNGCTRLKYVPDFKLRSFGVTSGNSVGVMDNMFANCYALISWGHGTRMKATDFISFRNAFNGCISMYETPNFDAPWMRDATNMFATCRLIEKVYPYDTSNCITGQGMFSDCSNITTIPDFSTRSMSALDTMFLSCHRLTTPLSLSAGTGLTASASRMFQNCVSLANMPSGFNGTGNNIRNASFMFSGCHGIDSMVLSRFLPDTSRLQNMNFMFGGNSLTNLPYLDVGGVTHNSNALFSSGGDFRICRGGLSGTRTSINYSNSNLSPSALDEIFQGLSAGRGGLTPGTIRTITITNCWGATGCDRTIATNKGWTVSG